MMSSADGRLAPQRLQADKGPPWAEEDATTVRMLNYDFKEAIPAAVKVQIDIRVDRRRFLDILRSLARQNVAYAKELVAGAEDFGSAHAKLEHLLVRFGPRVVMEVHDLLVEPTRPDQVCMVLHTLARHLLLPHHYPFRPRSCLSPPPLRLASLSLLGSPAMAVYFQSPLVPSLPCSAPFRACFACSLLAQSALHSPPLLSLTHSRVPPIAPLSLLGSPAMYVCC